MDALILAYGIEQLAQRCLAGNTRTFRLKRAQTDVFDRHQNYKTNGKYLFMQNQYSSMFCVCVCALAASARYATVIPNKP